MAMIKCPNCDEEISSKAKVCPYCNNKLKKGKTKLIIIIAVILLVLIATAVVLLLSYKAKKNREAKEAREKYVAEYNMCIENFNSIKSRAPKAIDKADYLASLTVDVWSGAIRHKGTTSNIKYIYKDGVVQDYESALKNMYSDPSVKSDISSINSIKSDINKLLEDTKNCPDELKDTYNAAQEFVSAFNDRVDFCTSASGSLAAYSTTFASKKSTYDSKMSNFSLKIPEKIKE